MNACTAEPLNDGNRIRLLSGRWVDPLSGDVTTPLLSDIAHGLALINRFNGHTVCPWSVAAHSLCCYHLATPPAKRYALFHDAAEAYVGDWQRPVKHRLPPAFAEAEERFAVTVFRDFGVSRQCRAEVERIDDLMCAAERFVLQPGSPAAMSDDTQWRQAVDLINHYRDVSWEGIKNRWLQAEAQCRN